jgi:hypothetical protein
MFYPGSMNSSATDRILIAKLSGSASRLAHLVYTTAQQRAAAVSELMAVAEGRADLLARHAGMTVGVHAERLDEGHYLTEAQLCIDAGADINAIPRWIAEGQRRAREIQLSRESRRSADPAARAGGPTA